MLDGQSASTAATMIERFEQIRPLLFGRDLGVLPLEVLVVLLEVRLREQNRADEVAPVRPVAVHAPLGEPRLDDGLGELHPPRHLSEIAVAGEDHGVPQQQAADEGEHRRAEDRQCDEDQSSFHATSP